MQTLKNEALGQGPGPPRSREYVQSQRGVSRNPTNWLSSYLRAPQALFPWARVSPREGSGAETTCGHQEAPAARSRGNWLREARHAGLCGHAQLCEE